jgi:hypothetical protein
MKKYSFLFVVLLLSACQKSTEPTVLQDTENVVNDYADTLTGSVHDAKNVVNQLNERNNKVQGQIDAGIR